MLQVGSSEEKPNNKYDEQQASDTTAQLGTAVVLSSPRRPTELEV
jgi:hypothetical protein